MDDPLVAAAQVGVSEHVVDFCVLFRPPVFKRCVERFRSSKHLPHAAHVAHVPRVEVSVEICSAFKHQHHVINARNIPMVDIPVELGGITEHVPHTYHVFYVQA